MADQFQLALVGLAGPVAVHGQRAEYPAAGRLDGHGPGGAETDGHGEGAASLPIGIGLHVSCQHRAPEVYGCGARPIAHIDDRMFLGGAHGRREPCADHLGEAPAIGAEPPNADHAVAAAGLGEIHRGGQHLAQRRVGGDALEHVAFARHDDLYVLAVADVGDAGAHQAARPGQRHQPHLGGHGLAIAAPITPLENRRRAGGRPQQLTQFERRDLFAPDPEELQRTLVGVRAASSGDVDDDDPLGRGLYERAIADLAVAQGLSGGQAFAHVAQADHEQDAALDQHLAGHDFHRQRTAIPAPRLRDARFGSAPAGGGIGRHGLQAAQQRTLDWQIGQQADDRYPDQFGLRIAKQLFTGRVEHADGAVTRDRDDDVLDVVEDGAQLAGVSTTQPLGESARFGCEQLH